MTFDPTKPVRTRDGRAVEILRHDLNAEQPIIGIVKSAEGIDEVEQWSAKGGYLYSDQKHSPHDLINIPEERVTYAPLYRGPRGGNVLGDTHEELDAAKKYAETFKAEGIVKITRADGVITAVELVK